MAWIADAHYEWHHANIDRPWDCPLDCGAGERDDDHEYEDVESGNFPIPVPAEWPPVGWDSVSVPYDDGIPF